MISNAEEVVAALRGTKWEEPLMEAIHRQPQEL
jgi:hypothetical protein